MSPFLSNLIRAYRITNEEKLYLKYIMFLQSEMRNAKHSKDMISKVTTSALNHIEKNICKRTLHSLRDKSSKNLFCPSTVFSSTTNSDGVLINTLHEAYQTSGQRNLVFLPSRTVGRKMHNIVFVKSSTIETSLKIWINFLKPHKA